MADIKATFIFEMLGRPPEHLKSTLIQFIDKLGKEEGVEIINQNLNEPKRIDKAEQELYSTFAEIEASFRNMEDLMRIVFSYMPSHIEVTFPTEINLKNFELNSLMNSLTLRLHKYDELAKALAIERDFLKRKLQQIPTIPPEKKKDRKIMKNNKRAKKNNKSKKKG